MPSLFMLTATLDTSMSVNIAVPDTQINEFISNVIINV